MALRAIALRRPFNSSRRRGLKAGGERARKFQERLGRLEPLKCGLHSRLITDSFSIAAVLDLTWVYSELAPYYPKTGRPSIDPALMIRMLIVGYRQRRGARRRLGGRRPRRGKECVEAFLAENVRHGVPRHLKPSFSDNASSLASKIAQLNTQISCIRAGLHPITSVWCPMSYYRFIARDNASQAAELGGMALENDDMARGFGANVIRDLIREAPSQHAGWILEIARGDRVVAAIPFGD